MVESLAREDNRKIRVPEAEANALIDGEGRTAELSSSNGSKSEKAQKNVDEEQKGKPSKLTEMSAKVGLDAGTLMMMLKLVYFFSS